MQIYLSVTPTQVHAASAWCRSFAHVAYSVGRDCQLLRNSLLVQTRGGLLSLTDQGMPLLSDLDGLCAAVLRECNRRGYSGMIADFENAPTPDRRQFLTQVADVLRHNRRTLYVPQVYCVEGAVPLLCTATSGGDFRTYLQEAVQTGPMPALDAQRLIMDFPLPSPSGEGTPISLDQLQTLMEQRQPAVFYAPDLCAKYFTYTENGEGHFVLFDDASTLQEKLRAASDVGISTAFLQYPEVEDLMPELFAPSQT